MALPQSEQGKPCTKLKRRKAPQNADAAIPPERCLF
jgi:hypothetical protein